MNDDIDRLADINRKTAELYKALHSRIVGQDHVLEMVWLTILSRGHCLITGVPGLAKTLLVQTLAKCLALDSGRIQFTPDLMPSDVTGTEVINEEDGRRVFNFVSGPVFTNLLLADEVNRTPPKTQAALLEAMQEGQVTLSGTTRKLPRPFHVLATQNPIEQEGTYPLPEAQLDRFLLSIDMDYPSIEDEIHIARLDIDPDLKGVEPLITNEELLGYQQMVARVPVAEHILAYAVDIVRSSRPESCKLAQQYVLWGAGPRAVQHLVLAARARALVQNRPAPNVEDIRELAKPVLKHRLVLNFRAQTEGLDGGDIIARLLRDISVPLGGR